MNLSIRNILKGLIAGIAIGILLASAGRPLLGLVLAIIFCLMLSVLPTIIRPALNKTIEPKSEINIKWAVLGIILGTLVLFVLPPYIVFHTSLIGKILPENRPAVLFIYIYLVIFGALSLLVKLITMLKNVSKHELKNKITVIFFLGPILGAAFFYYQYSFDKKFIYMTLLVIIVPYKFYKRTFKDSVTGLEKNL